MKRKQTTPVEHLIQVVDKRAKALTRNVATKETRRWHNRQVREAIRQVERSLPPTVTKPTLRLVKR